MASGKKWALKVHDALIDGWDEYLSEAQIEAVSLIIEQAIAEERAACKSVAMTVAPPVAGAPL